MMKPSVLLLAALGFFSACDDDDEIVDIGGEGDVVIWTADIFGIPPFQYIGGNAEVSYELGAFELGATAEIFGDTPGAVRPWHVHFGTCASGGDIVGLDSDYLALVVDGAGADVVSVIVPEPLDVDAFYHVNFHLSPDRQDVIIACGDLVLR